MDFVIKIPYRQRWQLHLRDYAREDGKTDNGNADLFMGHNGNGYTMVTDTSGTISFVTGDLIIPHEYKHQPDDYLKHFLKDFNPERLREARGSFYIIIVNEREQEIKVFNSIMGIIPIYYFTANDYIIVSSRADSIIKASVNIFEVNKKYILEHLLFGYGFKSNTLFKEVLLLSANHFLKVEGSGISVIEHTSISDFYVSRPLGWEKAVDSISDLFIERASGYLPDERYYSSFTGGLDSRTLLALGLSRKKEIIAYSYGSSNDKDVKVPKEISKKLGLEYRDFILDEGYATSSFFENAVRANLLTEGTLRFSRAAYLFMVEEIAKVTPYMITGNFGSELLRTTRMSGNLISKVIFDMFDPISDAELAVRIRTSPRLRYIRKDHFKKEIEETIQECTEYRKCFNREITSNQRFYRFVYEEVFRKYFGPEIILESKFLANRTPFLDFTFIKELFKTELAGCNGEYKVSNPLERYKGQVLYPLIIRKTYPDLLKYKLDREYSPGDFLNLFGEAKIILGFLLRKTILDKKRYRQPGYNHKAYKTNIDSLSMISYSYSFVDTAEFDLLFINDGWEDDHINFNIYITLFDYLNQIKMSLRNVRFE